mmetsp:Transcript_6963/g.13143  ORF Transcript_6963/g.13143 Transcript_6963/m.13143 type:complete len:135 (-) Transcript_6963:2349-2753(-)
MMWGMTPEPPQLLRQDSLDSYPTFISGSNFCSVLKEEEQQQAQRQCQAVVPFALCFGSRSGLGVTNLSFCRGYYVDMVTAPCHVLPLDCPSVAQTAGNCYFSGVEILDRCVNDPSAGSPTETLLRLHLPLSDKV